MDITKALLLALVVIGIGLLCLVWLCFAIFIARLIKTATRKKHFAELEKEIAELKEELTKARYIIKELLGPLQFVGDPRVEFSEPEALEDLLERAKAFVLQDGCVEYTLTQWHDLRKNPDDLPNTDDKEHEYVVSDNLGCRMLARYYCGKWSNYGLIDNVIAWCGLPTFEE